MLKKLYYIRNWREEVPFWYDFLKKNQFYIVKGGVKSENITKDIDKFEPDLIIIDVHPDDTKGSLKLLDQIQNHNPAPFIIYSNNPDRLNVDQLLNFEVYGVFSDSTSNTELLIKIKIALNRYTQMQQLSITDRIGFEGKSNEMASSYVSKKKMKCYKNKEIRSKHVHQTLNSVEALNAKSNFQAEKIEFEGDVDRELVKKHSELKELNRNLNRLVEERTKNLQNEINQRRQAQELHKRFFNVIEQSSDLIMIANTEGVIEYVNPALCKYTFYNRDEVIGEKPSIFKSGMHDDTYYNLVWSTIKNGDSFSDEFVNKKKNGDLYTVAQLIMPLKNLDGEITHFASVSRDFTEKRKLEKQLMDIQEEERSRISRELHDGIGQSVAAIKMSISRISEKYGLPKYDFHDTMNLIESLTSSIREISYDLMPSVLKDYGLVTATLKMIKQIEKNTQIDISFNYTNEKKRLPGDIELSLFRILQESLNNAISYSGATRLVIYLNCTDSKIFLNVTDNGHGFDYNNGIHGQGIRNMRHRAHLMNGVFQLLSSDEGTVVKVRVPFKNCTA